MRLGQIWDYLMRRKPLVVALFVLILSGFYGYNLAARGDLAGRAAKREDLTEDATTVAKKIDNGITMQILGKNQAVVLKVTMQNNGQEAAVEVNANSLASGAYVRIIDAAGKLVAGEYTRVYDAGNSASGKGVEYYFPDTPKKYTVALAAGMRIELQAKNAKFYSTLDGAEVAEFAPKTEVESYVVTAGGLKREDWSEATTREIMYRQMRRYAGRQINEYWVNIPEHVLYNKTLEVEKKAEIMQLYAELWSADREVYAEFIEQLRKGGEPVIAYRGAMEYKRDSVVDLWELVDINDNEDGKIARENIKVEGAVDFAKPGSYDLVYSAVDSDGNVAQLKLTIGVSEERAEGPSEVPSEGPPVVDEPAVEPTPGPVTEDEGLVAPILDEIETEVNMVWDASGSAEASAPAARVDYDSVATEGGSTEAAIEEASTAMIAVNPEKEEKKAETATQPTERKTEKIAEKAAETEKPSEKTQATAKGVGGKVIFAVVGMVVACGLVKFISDRYVR